jgi:alkylation response protein AidB-like acyl-CoA dehydrogenase
MSLKTETTSATLNTLPSDDVRQIMWRFSERFDLQMAVQNARSVARGPVARLVAEGARNTHDWTEAKSSLLQAFDESGITSVYMDPEYGGFIEGPKNLALALVAFELAWVDGGAATSSLAGCLALAPIHEKGTPQQIKTYMTRALPGQPGEDREVWRGAFSLTEPLPYAGVDASMLGGTAKVVEWEDGKEPILEVEKRGRFITNMDFANFVTAAVGSKDDRLKGTCMVILEEGDPGTYDRGAPTRKLVHQLSSTRDPVFRLRIPANRIIGGYTVEDGVIVPNHSHGEIIEAVFRRTRVTVGVMSAAKLLSAVEPVIRYQRQRFRGGSASSPGSPRYDIGLQQKEDVLHRLVDVWATGEAAASLGFAAAQLFDRLDPLEKRKNQIFEEREIFTLRNKLKAQRNAEKDGIELLKILGQPLEMQDSDRLEELRSDPLVEFALLDSEANVLCPACKLWNTGHGANLMREAVSLMGGYGITEDCPGFLGQKWMDSQLEATYEGPEAVQRRQLSITMTNPLFLAQFRLWIREMRKIAGQKPGSGACNLASAMELWLWTLEHLQKAQDADGVKLYKSQRQGVTFPLADALCWLVSARLQILDVLELEKRGTENPVLKESLEGFISFFTDLCHVQSASAAGEVGRICSELVYGYNRHPEWNEEEYASCYQTNDLAVLEGVIPGISGTAESYSDVIPEEEFVPQKAGPCVRFDGYEEFARLRARLDGCLTGNRLAKDRAASALVHVMIPEALDYPL